MNCESKIKAKFRKLGVKQTDLFYFILFCIIYLLLNKINIHNSIFKIQKKKLFENEIVFIVFFVVIKTSEIK